MTKLEPVPALSVEPGIPEEYVGAARQSPTHRTFFDRIEGLGRYENFTLVGIAAPNGQGGRSNIYVHAKIMLVDDVWATIGSCNLHSNSLSGHTEMNAAFRDPTVVRALRYQLLSEHLGEDTAQLDDRAALRLYRNIAHANGLRRESRDAKWQGLAFVLSAAAYGR